MKKLEAKFQTEFSKWVKNRWDGGSAAFELKRTTTQSLAMSAIADHQITALLQVCDRGGYYKIPDGGFAQAPYDCYYLAGQAYIVVAYGLRLTGFYMIDISDVVLLKENGAKSITEVDAKRLGTYITLPKKTRG